MITIVNGYVCNNCSEAADARKGKDPHAKPGELPYSSDKNDKFSAFADQPATIFDGALKSLLTANPVTAAAGSDASHHSESSTSQLKVDFLA
jgi:hypothetical protein